MDKCTLKWKRLAPVIWILFFVLTVLYKFLCTCYNFAKCPSAHWSDSSWYLYNWFACSNEISFWWLLKSTNPTPEGICIGSNWESKCKWAQLKYLTFPCSSLDTKCIFSWRKHASLSSAAATKAEERKEGFYPQFVCVILYTNWLANTSHALFFK